MTGPPAATRRVLFSGAAALLLSMSWYASLVSANKLHDAARTGDVDGVVDLLSRTDRNGLIPDCECWFFGLRCEVCSLDDTHRGGLTPAMYATGQGHYDVMRHLIKLLKCSMTSDTMRRQRDHPMSGTLPRKLHFY